MTAEVAADHLTGQAERQKITEPAWLRDLRFGAMLAMLLGEGSPALRQNTG